MKWFQSTRAGEPTGPPGEPAFAHDPVLRNSSLPSPSPIAGALSPRTLLKKILIALNRFLPMANASQKRLRNASCRPERPWSRCLLRTSRAFDLD